MKTNVKTLLLIVAVLGFTALACNLTDEGPVAQPTNTSDIDSLYTQVAQTMQAQDIATAVSATETAVASPNPPDQTATANVLPSATALPASTSTRTPTAVVLPSDWASFVGDVTIYDGATFTPGATFTKTWRLKNIGTRTWTTDYDLVFVGGANLDAKARVPLPYNVSPGQTVDVSVRLTAPDEPGTYTGLWQLRNTSGVLFGLGDQASGAFWVQIKVVKPNPDYAYDFAINLCAADWTSSSADLPCTGKEGDRDGFVQFLADPILENRHENEPAIWLFPGRGDVEWISGTFPEYRVRKNDHFIAWVGCLANNEDCDVTFQLNYDIDGKSDIETLGEWHEVYDGKVSTVDVDLSKLEGEDVHIILSVINNGKRADANAFWFVPHISRVTPTQTPTVTPTATQTPTMTPTVTLTPTATATDVPPVQSEGFNSLLAYGNCFDLDAGLSYAGVDASCDFQVNLGSSGDGSDIEIVPAAGAGFAFDSLYGGEPSLGTCAAATLDGSARNFSPVGQYLCFSTNMGRTGFIYFDSYDAVNGMTFDWRTYQ